MHIENVQQILATAAAQAAAFAQCACNAKLWAALNGPSDKNKKL